MEAFPTLPEWITLEHQVATILTNQEHHGWYFDEQSARELESTLRNELHQLKPSFEQISPTLPEQISRPNEKTRGLAMSKACRLLD